MAVTPFPLHVHDLRVHATQAPTVTEEYDTNLAKYVAKFPESGTTDLHYALLIPVDGITGNLTVRLQWRTTDADTGDTARWQVEHVLVATGVSPTGSAGTATGVTDNNGGAGYLNEATITVSLTSPASKVLAFRISRLPADGGDTLTGDLLYITGDLSYVADVTTRKNFAWISPAALRLSGATLSYRSFASTPTIHPHTAVFRDAQSDYGTAILTLPSNYSGNLTAALAIVGKGDSGNSRWRLDMAKRSVGDNVDPSLTTGTAFTITHGNTDRVYVSSEQTAPITPAALDDLIIKVSRLGSDGADTNALSVDLLGVLLTWDTFTRSPGVIELAPCVWTPPASGGSTPTSEARTNFTEILQRFANGSEQACDVTLPVPTHFLNGGTLVVRWATTQASGNARFRVDYGSPAPGASSTDPALSAGTETQSACAGASKVNEVRLSVSGLAALDAGNLRLVRAGDDALDTVEGAVDVVRAWLEINLAA